ncbi:MAG: WD40/YVTN/BNR-like repeat-containing protein [Woeseia sp.]
MSIPPRLRLRALLYLVLLAHSLPATAALDADLLKGLTARTLGPAAVGGRIAAIDAVVSDPNRIVVGVATGGIWISDNGGVTWEPVFDNEAVASIGALAINQSNPDIIWAGTGESNVRNSTSIGGGVYKTVDGGRSWQFTGLAASERIDRIALHPGDPDIAYVAALGTLWAPNSERGVYKTTDGGDTWDRILYVDQLTGATDIKMDPSNPDKLYAGMWQFRRWPYFFRSGGPGSGMYISYDAGETWKQKTEEDGLPEGELGRMVIAMSAAEPKRVYALVEAEKSALLVSIDGGETWSTVNEAYDISDRPFYYTEIAADPENADRVYNIGTRLRVSIDGGKNFETNAVIDCCAPGNTLHIDNHAFWINPGDPRHIIIGNDGGLGITRDRGETWRFVRNMPLAQFYHVAVDDDHPYHVYGGLQDNGSWRGPSEVWENAGIRNLHWQEVGFGDGFDTVPDPDNSRSGYVMSQGGYLVRWDLDTGERRLIRPDPPTPDVDLRFNWNAGFAQDPFDAATIYYGSQYLHKSVDRGNTWTVISDDLTSNDPDMQTFRESGGLTYDVTAAENYTSIVAVAPSRLERGLIWVGTDDGRVHVTRDGGASWTRIDQRARGVPAGAWVPMIAPSPHDASTAFVVFDDHRRGNMATYVYRVENYGRRWRSLTDDTLSGYALSVLQDHVDPKLLFLGTEFGLFVSVDAGSSWTKFTAGVPTVSVMDMAIQERENDLVLGTHGRSVFVIDDYRALRGLSQDDFESRLAILSATPGQHYVAGHTPSTRFTGSAEFRAENEPYGVMLTFMASGGDLPHPDAEAERDRRILLRESGRAEEDEENGEDDDEPKVTVTVRDAGGDVIRSYREAVHQGINRLTWNMRRDGARELPGPEKKDYTDGLPDGPEVPPGRYSITLALDHPDSQATVDSVDVHTVADPRSTYSQAEIERNYRTQLELLSLERTVVRAVERIVGARSDIETITELVSDRPDAEENESLSALKEQAGELGKTLDELEKRFRTPPETKGIVYGGDRIANRLGLAQAYVASTRDSPSAAADSYIEIARNSIDEGLSELNDFIDSELADFRKAVDEAGIAPLSGVTPVAVTD